MSVMLAALSLTAGLFMGGPDHQLTCDVADFHTGRTLTNGDHINMDVVQGDRKFQVNAYVDRNIQGGHDTLGVRFSDGTSKPLTQAEVESGVLVFQYSNLLADSPYTVEWVQYNSSYFNQDRDSDKFLDCAGEVPPVIIEPPVQPDDIIVEEILESRGETECIAGVHKTPVFFTKQLTTIVFEYDETTNEWVEGEPIVEIVDEWSSEEVGSDCELPDTGAEGLIVGALAAAVLIGAGLTLTRRAHN
jgi:LPXTG-motif cell wall-anchored protein